MNKQKDAVQEAIYGLKAWVHVHREPRHGIDSMIHAETILAVLESSPVDVAFPIMALKDAALMLERTPTKGGVTELGAENCHKAIAQLKNTPPQSPVTKEDAREALNYLEASEKLGDIDQFLPKSIAETIRKCLQAVCDD